MGSSKMKPRYTIGDAGRITGLETHVLRFWETEFPELSPVKSNSGRRMYTDEDIEVIERIKTLLYEKTFTIEGARNFLQNQESSVQQTKMTFSGDNLKQTLSEVKKELREIIDLLE